MFLGVSAFPVIPYQEKLGNYNPTEQAPTEKQVIPYQEKLGNNHKVVHFDYII